MTKIKFKVALKDTGKKISLHNTRDEAELACDQAIHRTGKGYKVFPVTVKYMPSGKRILGKMR